MQGSAGTWLTGTYDRKGGIPNSGVISLGQSVGGRGGPKTLRMREA